MHELLSWTVEETRDQSLEKKRLACTSFCTFKRKKKKLDVDGYTSSGSKQKKTGQGKGLCRLRHQRTRSSSRREKRRSEPFLSKKKKGGKKKKDCPSRFSMV